MNHILKKALLCILQLAALFFACMATLGIAVAEGKVDPFWQGFRSWLGLFAAVLLPVIAFRVILWYSLKGKDTKLYDVIELIVAAFAVIHILPISLLGLDDVAQLKYPLVWLLVLIPRIVITVRECRCQPKYPTPQKERLSKTDGSEHRKLDDMYL